MRWHCMLLLGLAMLAGTLPIAAASGRIVKVLPHWVDRQGRIAVHPSLFERDAYQAMLRADRSACGGLRFDVQWKARPKPGAQLRLKVELVTTTTSRQTPLVLERPVKARTGWSRWSRVLLDGEAFQKAGGIISWRVSLWNSNDCLAETTSFLW